MSNNNQTIEKETGELAKELAKIAQRTTSASPINTQDKAVANQPTPAAVKPKKKTKAKATTGAKKTASKKAASPKVIKVQPSYQSPQEIMEKIMTKTNPQMDQFMKDANSMMQESTDALMKSTNLFAKGFEEIMKATTTMAQNVAEKQADFAKEAMAVKTIDEWSDLQNKNAQASYNDFISEATKISELSVKVLTEASEPLNAQVNKTVQQASKAAA